MTGNLSQAVGTLAGCLTAVVELGARCPSDEGTVRRALTPHKRNLQQILEQRLLSEVAEVLTTARREVQIIIEYLCDAVDYSRQRSHETEYTQRVGYAATLLTQLIEELTAGRPKVKRIEAVRARTARPFACGYNTGVPLRLTERGVPNLRKRRERRYGLATACY